MKSKYRHVFICILQAPEAADMQTVLRERLENYKAAFSAAESAGESSKARRYQRGIKVS